MGYKSWWESHALKHKKIVEKLSHLSDKQIVEYFKYENMVTNEPDFCILYKENKKCHEMTDLNCYFCACPNFRVETNRSYCSIDSKDGGKIEHNGFIHQDCSKCLVPHNEKYILNNFDRNWKKVFKDTFSN